MLVICDVFSPLCCMYILFMRHSHQRVMRACLFIVTHSHQRVMRACLFIVTHSHQRVMRACLFIVTHSHQRVSRLLCVPTVLSADGHTGRTPGLIRQRVSEGQDRLRIPAGLGVLWKSAAKHHLRIALRQGAL